MSHEEEINARERLARHWLEAEPSVQAYVFAAVSGFQDAEDVLQQVALTVARRFDEYDATRSFCAWALWLAKSRIADHYRKKGRERLVFSEALMDQLAEVLVQQQPERAARHEVLALRYEEGAPMDRVAEAIESTASAVRVILFRIRNLLAECMNSELTRTTP